MRQALTAWLLTTGLQIVLIVALAIGTSRVLALALRRFEAYAGRHDGPGHVEHLKRARTLTLLVGNVARVLLITVTILMVLQKLDLDIRPILAGAGILGLALGFGAQTLVKDVISGFFIILENQIRVGDTAEINGTGGLVEAINLRTIVLRDVRGAVHVFPCGSVTTLANLTKDFAFAVLDVNVHYRHDPDEVMDVLRQTAGGLQKDPAFAQSIQSPLEILGIEDLGESGMKIRVRIKTPPQKQWEVTRELRRRIKKAFDEKGIEIPAVQPASAPRPPAT